MTKYGIVGTRTFNDYNMLYQSISHIQDMTCIVSGGAKGTDTLAERYAMEKNIATVIIRPDWNRYGKSAGPIRNRTIVEQSDVVIAFWDYNSKGTKSTIDICRELGKQCYIIDIRK